MPIGTRPNTTYNYVLEGDKELENPPVFICKYRNMDSSKEIDAFRKRQVDAGDDVDLLFDVFIDIIIHGLDGWENMKNPNGKEYVFSEDHSIMSKNISEMMTVGEVAELMGILLNEGVTSEDKKKLDSPSESDTAESVKDAKAPKSVPTSQPDTSP